MENSKSGIEGRASRRSFLRTGTLGVGAALGTGLLSQQLAGAEEDGGPLNRGDIAILTFLSALEQVEADLWIQYAELGGAVTAVAGAEGLSAIDLQLHGNAISTRLFAGYV